MSIQIFVVVTVFSVSNCPEVFQLDDGNPVTVMMDLVPAELEESCQAAADSCPTEAISIKE